jgi:hypothetical protein
MATVAGVCENCGAVFGSEALSGAEGRGISLGGAKVGPCPSCGGTGRVPEGTYDLIDDTLRVVRAAAIEKVVFDAVIEILEGHAEGMVSEEQVLERVTEEAPELAPTIKSYLGKSDPASWLALLLSILTLIQSSTSSPPSAEDIARAISSGGTLTREEGSKPAAQHKALGKSSRRTKRPPKTHGKSKQTKSRKRR